MLSGTALYALILIPLLSTLGSADGQLRSTPYTLVHSNPSYKSSGHSKLTIIHVNDIHAHFDVSYRTPVLQLLAIP